MPGVRDIVTIGNARAMDRAEHYSYNIITNEERDLTDEQYNDSNYTLNT